MPLSVREMRETDIPLITNYWQNAEPDYLLGMGVDPTRVPPADQFSARLRQQLALPYEEKQSYCTIWQFNDRPIGHCNTNPTEYGDHAFMHLHIWHAEFRKSGYGYELLKVTLPFFFENLKLSMLYCQPYALNPAPNRTLEKLGFDFVKEYITTPGSFSFEQPTKLWEMTLERYLALLPRVQQSLS